MGRIFINYRRQDSEGYVGRLYDHLTQHFAREDVFIDVDNIRPGVDFVKALEDAVAACDVFLAVIGPHWLTAANDAGERRLDEWNDFVRIELISAINMNKAIIPVLVGHARMPSLKELPEEIAALARRNAFELSHQRFGVDVAKLADIIKAAAPKESLAKPPIDNETLLQKEAALKKVRLDLIGATASPLYQFRTENRLFPVMGDGNANANIMFIGEAPGKTEAQQGIPFIGPSGEILADMLKSIGLKREDVYITNLLLDRPPENRDPSPEEIAFYTPFVDRIVDIVQPSVIATLGLFAMEYLLKRLGLTEKKPKMKEVHGKLMKVQLPYGEVHVVPLYHPASVLYSPTQKEMLKQDFQKLKLFV
jgi:uracil-DNA glycosylase family 4